MNFIIEKKQWNILKARVSHARFHVLMKGKDWVYFPDKSSRWSSPLNSSIWNSGEMTNGKMRLTLASQIILVEPFFRLDLETQRNE